MPSTNRGPMRGRAMFAVPYLRTLVAGVLSCSLLRGVSAELGLAVRRWRFSGASWFSQSRPNTRDNVPLFRRWRPPKSTPRPNSEQDQQIVAAPPRCAKWPGRVSVILPVACIAPMRGERIPRCRPNMEGGAHTTLDGHTMENLRSRPLKRVQQSGCNNGPLGAAMVGLGH